MAHDEHAATLGGGGFHLPVDLLHKGAGEIEPVDAALLKLAVTLLRHPVASQRHHTGKLKRHLLHHPHPLRLEAGGDLRIVDNGAEGDNGPGFAGEQIEDPVHRALDAETEAGGFRDCDLHATASLRVPLSILSTEF